MRIVETAKRRSVGTAPPALMRQGVNERMVDCMAFTEDLQARKNDARQEYKKACADWMETRTADNINGNFEKWKIVCDKKRDCMRLGVII